MALAYILFSILLAGFFHITYKNSPKHGYILLGIVVASIIIGQIKPIQMYSLLGIVGVLVVMVKSRSVREKRIQQWFANNGFKYIKAPYEKALFNVPLSGTIIYHTYQNELVYLHQSIPYVLSVLYNSYRNGNTISIVLHCSYYFKDGVDVELLEQRFKAAKERTPHSNFFKSHFRYFDIKKIDIFKPSIGGLVVCWRVPDTVEGYNDRLNWIKNCLTN